jgi:hypothetical protein
MLRGPIRTGLDREAERLRIVLDLVEGASYRVKHDLFLSGGLLGEGARYVLELKRISHQ